MSKSNELNEKALETERDSQALEAIEGASKTAWDSVRSVTGALNDSIERAAKEHLPAVGMAGTSTSEPWTIYGRETPFYERVQPLTANDAKLADAARNSSIAAPFGDKYGIAKRDAQGHESVTTWGTTGLEHKDSTGETHINRRGARHSASDGSRAEMDRRDHTITEIGKKHTKVAFDHNTGKIQVDDGKGHTLQWEHGKLLSTSRDGASTEVTDQKVIHAFRHSMWEVRQHRGHHDHAHDAEGRRSGGSIDTTIDDEDKSKQMLVINDGQGTTIKVHQDGRKEIILAEDNNNNKTTIMTVPDSRELLAVHGNDLYVLRPENKQWNAYDVEGNRLGTLQDVMPRFENVAAGGLKLTDGTSITAGGDIQTHNKEGQGVEVNAESHEAVVKNANGIADNVTVIATNSGSKVSHLEPGGTQTTTVDLMDNSVRQGYVMPDGSTDGSKLSISALEPGRKDYLNISTSDGPITVTKDQAGNDVWSLWNKDKLDTSSATLNLSDGTIFNLHQGKVSFNDGISVDEDGSIWDGQAKAGFAGGSSWDNDDGDDWDDSADNDFEATESSSVGDAESLAAQVAGKSGDADLNDVGNLLDSYCNLEDLKTKALTAGDLDAVSRLDSAIAATDQAISTARIQIAQQEILKSLTAVSPDLLAQAHHLMPNTVMPDALRQFLEEKGILTDGTTQV